MSKQSAVEYLYERLERMIPRTISYDIDKRQYLEQAKEMEKQQSQNYAIFAIRCDRTEMRILDFNDYIKLEENEEK
jgi:hypothetical protein